MSGWISVSRSVSVLSRNAWLNGGGALTYETSCQWCLTFSQMYAPERNRRHRELDGKWHLDEVILKLNGKQPSRGSAADQHGNILDILVQSRRNKQKAKKLFRKLLKGLAYVPESVTTDGHRSYPRAVRERMGNDVAHRTNVY